MATQLQQRLSLSIPDSTRTAHEYDASTPPFIPLRKLSSRVLAQAAVVVGPLYFGVFQRAGFWPFRRGRE
jgi:hypothetical protein